MPSRPPSSQALVYWNRFYRKHRNQVAQFKDWVQASILLYREIEIEPFDQDYLLDHYLHKVVDNKTFVLVPVSIILTARNISISADMSGFEGDEVFWDMDTFSIREFRKKNSFSFHSGKINHIAYKEIEGSANRDVDYMQELFPVSYDHGKGEGAQALGGFKTAFEELTRNHTPTAPAPL